MNTELNVAICTGRVGQSRPFGCIANGSICNSYEWVGLGNLGAA